MPTGRKMSILKSLKSLLKNEEVGTVATVGCVGDLAGWIDTGSYSLNALLSGSIYGGLPSNKITAFSGKSGVGKTYYLLQAIAGFQATNPENVAIIFDSEAAITAEMIVSHGCDPTRTVVIAVATIEEFRTACVKILEQYKEDYKDKGFKEPRMIIALDSLGNLSTKKEVTDMGEGSDKRDMTKAQLIRGAFRVLTIMCGQLNVPMLLTNHTYDAVGAYVPTQVQSGGMGLIYAASTIILLTKSKEKEGTETIGAIIKAKTEKARLTKEQQSVLTLLNFNNGLDKYYGLFDMAVEAGIFKKVSTRYELPDGSKAFEVAILRDPAKFFTKDVLDRIDAWAGPRFKYQGGGSEEPGQVIDEDPADETA